MYVNVILPLPLYQNFTYSIPEKYQGRLEAGYRVLVPFGNKKFYTAIVKEVHSNAPVGYKVKDILEVLDTHPIIHSQQLKLWEWISQYYLCSLGEVFKAAVPSGLKPEEGDEEDRSYQPKTKTCVRLTDSTLPPLTQKQERVISWLKQLQQPTPKELAEAAQVGTGIIKLLREKGVLEYFQVQVDRITGPVAPEQHSLKELSVPQQQALNRIQNAFRNQDVCLLHGVTSSGKTEIYIHLIQQALDAGKQVLYLLPEIALTTQITERLTKVFGNRLAVYHSKYPDATRVEIWQKQLSQTPYDIILGVRSSIFLPFQNLGLVLIDEEHETSYKQQDPAPRYHARSVALMLAAQCGAKTLLGTATPSLDSYYLATIGKYAYVPLTQRYQGLELPDIQVVDLTQQKKEKRMNGPFSHVLLAAMQQALERNEQIILFQNRRGFAPQVECQTCGWVPRCQNCDVSLTYHKRLQLLTCHYCGYTYSLPQQCPSCEEEKLVQIGYGTERIEDLVQQFFPTAQVARMDLDTTRTRTGYERIIQQFQDGKTDILIGTQMVTKGLDFRRVSVVGILDADRLLNYPDFRAYERAFQMMAQVSGRAGRHGHRGTVILQTRSTQLPVITQVVHNDYRQLYDQQVAERQQFHYPPFNRLINVYLKHKDESALHKIATTLATQLRHTLTPERVLGPDTPPVAKVQTMYIRKIVLKLEQGINLQNVQAYLREVQATYTQQYHSLTIYFDVDPY